MSASRHDNRENLRIEEFHNAPINCEGVNHEPVLAKSYENETRSDSPIGSRPRSSASHFRERRHAPRRTNINESDADSHRFTQEFIPLIRARPRPF